MITAKEFDYDLWAVEDNGTKRYFCRIKATSEETEISIEVMRVLVNEDLKIKREYKKHQTYGHPLSLDYNSRLEKEDESTWEIDKTDFTEEIIFEMLEDEFLKMLTKKQKGVYLNCMKGNMKVLEYSKKSGLNPPVIYKHIEAIRKKYEKNFL